MVVADSGNSPPVAGTDSPVVADTGRAYVPAAGPVDAVFTVTNHLAFVRRVLAVGARVVGPPAIVDLAHSILAAHATAYEVP